MNRDQPLRLTIGSGVPPALGQIGTENSIVEGVEVGGHAVISLVVEVHLARERRINRLCTKLLSYFKGSPNMTKYQEKPPQHNGGSSTWAVLRTAIFRTMGGALAPKEAGMDF